MRKVVINSNGVFFLKYEETVKFMTEETVKFITMNEFEKLIMNAGEYVLEDFGEVCMHWIENGILPP